MAATDTGRPAAGPAPRSWRQMARCGGVVPLLRLPAKADDEHPVAAISAAPCAHAGLCTTSRCRAVGAAASASTSTEAAKRSLLDQEPVRRVFHIVSTGEPALAVQAGHLRRSPRHHPAGSRGLRFPTKQGTGLRRVIHSLSRPVTGNHPDLPPAVPRFSTDPGPGAGFPSPGISQPPRRLLAPSQQTTRTGTHLLSTGEAEELTHRET
jgi:hypothetical protein